MLALVLATAANAGFSIFIRVAQKRGANLTVVGAANYFIAVLFHLVLTLAVGFRVPHAATVIIGGVGGIFFSWAYFLLFAVMKRRGVSITGAILGLSVLIPVSVSFLAWGEGATTLQTIGIVVAIASLPFLSIGPRPTVPPLAKRSKGGTRTAAFISLAGLFIINGISMVPSRAFHQTGIQNEDSLFLLFIFSSATITTLVIWAVQEAMRRRRGENALPVAPAAPVVPGRAVAAGALPVSLLSSALSGVAVGLCNALTNRFIVVSLHSLPGIIVYPFYSAVGLLLMVGFSWIIWKDRISRMEMVGIALAVGSIVLINLVA